MKYRKRIEHHEEEKRVLGAAIIVVSTFTFIAWAIIATGALPWLS